MPSPAGPPRRTSSPLSSPSSAGAPHPQQGSPATSSTLPLTDDESELTEEEGDPTEGEREQEERADEGDDAEEEQGGIRPSRAASQISSASLTPPPSDVPHKSPSPQPNGNGHPINGAIENDTSERLLDEGEEEDGDVTMRAAEDTVDEQEDASKANGHVEQVEVSDAAMDGQGADEPELNGYAEEDANMAGEGEEDPASGDHLESVPIPIVGYSKHLPHGPAPPAAAMKELLMLEVKFAELRNCLYLEQMEEAAAEEDMILNENYPALGYLYKTLEERRERLHEGASKRYEAQVAEYRRMKDAEKHLVWSSWTDERERIHWEEFQATWSKRRKLAREKGLVETHRPTKPIPPHSNNIRNFDWAQDAVPSPLPRDAAYQDVLAMVRIA
ncbi:hypothetical protein L198_04324 [Cryptococcus wingfieldii CBS 7118]|uniref:Uncharacterized protein n=1 Tax=Cryptococcus wingfieldii CBS 7118 TaxID=1295528 RepID=A0A1E3J6I3_9TREE|nr:hypothetical protein L198_04324 [Cryptococcus wingfieldii CBS 7118]ODN95706.1 hypothetical protein L198_04324 [Cryptococcus wingfieldii CBS 7118]